MQHPRERAHPIGTARLVRLGLSNAEVRIAWNANAVETETPPWLPEGAAVLYPAAGARDLELTEPSAYPRALVVIDGTWHTARTLHRDKKWLHALPHFRLSPESPSRYRIRREPSASAVSTLEAILSALEILEPGLEGIDELLGGFDAMIDRQLAFVRTSTGRPRAFERRPLSSRRLPRFVVEDFARLVVTYGESARSNPDAPRELVQCTAVRVSTGEVFERLVRPTFGLPAAKHLDHMRLTERDFDRAVELPELRRAWRDFVAPERGAIVAAWNQGTLDLIQRTAGGAPSRASLKGAYRSSHGDHGGSLEEMAAREGWACSPLPFRGRAAERTALTLAVATELNRVAGGTLARLPGGVL